MLADGGECVSDLGAVREQNALFGMWRLTPRRGGWCRVGARPRNRSCIARHRAEVISRLCSRQSCALDHAEQSGRKEPIVFHRGRERLLRDGATAQGVVIQQQLRAAVTGVLSEYHVKVRVKFDDGSSIEFRQKLDSAQVGRHAEGAILPVRYDPRDHANIVIDVPAITVPVVDQAARHAAAVARAEQQIAHGSSPATHLAREASRSGLPTDAEMQTAWVTLQSAVADTSSMTDFITAKKVGDVAEQLRLKSLVAAHNAEVQALNAEFQRLTALRADWHS
jgi:hypothetical protein